MEKWENYFDKEKTIHSVIFLLASSGGSAKRKVIGDFLIDIFGIDEKQKEKIEKDAINWLDDIRKAMLERKYILDPQGDKSGIWKLTQDGKFEAAKNQVTFFLFWEKMKELCKD